MKSFLFIAAILFLENQAVSREWPLNQITEKNVLEISNNLFSLYKTELINLSVEFEFSYSHQDFVPTPLISSAEIRIKEKWDDFEQKSKPYLYLHLLGVFTRVSSMSEDGIALILCHELGHIFGGEPSVKNIYPGMDRALSVEGQSDYFASQSCFRKYATHFEKSNQAGVDPVVTAKCSARYKSNARRIGICERTIMAGISVLQSLNEIRAIQGNEIELFSTNKNSTLNQAEFGSTLLTHPDYQCRLDTYIAGALCDKESCEDTEGKRPACWFVQ